MAPPPIMDGATVTPTTARARSTRQRIEVYSYHEPPNVAVDETTARPSAVVSVRGSDNAPTRVAAIAGARTAAGYAAVGMVADLMLGK